MFQELEKQFVRHYQEVLMAISDPTQFGAYLKQRRKQLNYTQSFLSEVNTTYEELIDGPVDTNER